MWLGTMSDASRTPRAQARLAQVRPRRLAAEVVRDPVVVERIGRGRRVRVAAPGLDPPRRPAALPQADQPQARDPPAREPVELLVGDRVERVDVALVAARELVEPDVRALGDQHEARHPRGVAGEALGLDVEARQVGRLAPAATARAAVAAPAEPQVQAALLLGDDVEGDEEAVEEHVELGAEQAAPVLADVAQLAGEGRRVGAGGGPQHLDQRLAVGPDGRQAGLVRLERGHRLGARLARDRRRRR